MADGAYRKFYEVNRYSEKPYIKVEIENSKENNLEIPLPKGKVKVYQEDSDALLEFVGEDSLPHTAKKQPISLNLGKAFDILCDSLEKDRYEEEGIEYIEYEYQIYNQKDAAAPIKIEHRIHERSWKMVESSHEYEKMDSSTINFHLDVEADGSAVITFKYAVDRNVYVKRKTT